MLDKVDKEYNYRMLKGVVNDDRVWKTLDNYLEYLYHIKQIEMKRLNDTTELFRAQGFIAAIQQIHDLKAKVNAK